MSRWLTFAVAAAVLLFCAWRLVYAADTLVGGTNTDQFLVQRPAGGTPGMEVQNRWNVSKNAVVDTNIIAITPTVAAVSVISVATPTPGTASPPANYFVGCFCQADPLNAGNIALGSAPVMSTTAGASRGIVLQPGQSYTWPAQGGDCTWLKVAAYSGSNYVMCTEIAQ